MPYVLVDDFAKCIDRFSNGSPFGDDAKFDPMYQDLRSEVQKLTAHSSVDSSVNWKSIRKWSIEILARRSKDLTVASYLTLALFNLHGYGGMADGLEILYKYLKDDWEGIYPPIARPRNRALALEWLVTRIAPFMEDKAPLPAETALLRPLRERLEAFQEIVRLRLMHDAPSFLDLNAALAEHLANITDEEAQAPEFDDSTTGSRSTGTSSPEMEPGWSSNTPSNSGQQLPPLGEEVRQPPSLTPLSPTGQPVSPSDAADRIREIIPVLRQADLLAPLPYRLLRVLKWEGVAALPPINFQAPNPGTTFLGAPRAQVRASLESLYSAGNWIGLLQFSEGAFQEAGGTFWLDLQWYAIAALEGIDPVRSLQAVEAIKHEIFILLKRCETLQSLWFADRAVQVPGRPRERLVERTPFASETTQQWLVAIRTDSEEPVSSSENVSLPLLAASEENGELGSPAEMKAIQILLKKKKLSLAFDTIQTALEIARGRRSRFHIRLTAAKLSLEANQGAWAQAILEELMRESEQINFEDWEPKTAVDLYQLLAVCYSRFPRRGGPDDLEEARAQLEALRRKLLRLDLRAAATLDEALRR